MKNLAIIVLFTNTFDSSIRDVIQTVANSNSSINRLKKIGIHFCFCHEFETISEVTISKAIRLQSGVKEIKLAFFAAAISIHLFLIFQK